MDRAENTAWEKAYARGEFPFKEPHTEIEAVARELEKNRVKRILDLGSGAGRHTVLLARIGFDVYGLDSSPSGHACTLKLLSDEGLRAHITLHDMNLLPYDDAYFDAVVSVQVIHHNTAQGVRTTVGEVARVLKSRGWFWLTVPVSKNERSLRQKEIEPGTFVPLDGREEGLPHHYFKAEEIPPLLSGFNILDLHIDRVNHYSVLAQKTE